MASGCLVLVDGWNHFVAAQSCFGRDVAVKFPIDRLAAHVAAEAGEDLVTDVVVVMALPDRKRPEEEREFEEWRPRLNKLHNFGVRHEKARFSYHGLTCSGCENPLERKVTCPVCGRENRVAGRRKEKGADIRLSTLALNGAWRQEYSSLVIFSQDSDFSPLVRQLKEVHQEQGRRYTLYSAFPVCEAAGHKHYAVPGTKPLRIDGEAYAKLAQQPFANPLG